MALSSLTTDVLVDFQCQNCSFKAAGTYADVETARRAHRHPSFSLVPDRAEREGLWATYFEKPLSPLMADTTPLLQPYPRFRLLWGTLAALIVTAGGALFSRWLADTRYPSIGGWVHGSFMMLIVGGLVYLVLRGENNRRAAIIHRFRVVAECNHHIRNALCVLMYAHDTPDRDSFQVRREIGDAVRRIELTLSQVFPRVL
jgi:hypothetical protein